MKKRVNEIFDNVTAEELDLISDKLDAVELDGGTLEAIKSKVYAKTKVKRQRKKHHVWYRAIAVAACVCLTVGAVVILPFINGNEPIKPHPEIKDGTDTETGEEIDTDTDTDTETGETIDTDVDISTERENEESEGINTEELTDGDSVESDNIIIEEPTERDSDETENINTETSTETETILNFGSVVDSVSTYIAGNKITGYNEILLGDNSEIGGETSLIAPQFHIATVIEAEIIEVLPDTYRYGKGGSERHVAKVKVIESIRGFGIPGEIFISYPYYGTDIFDGYDRFIMSITQVGVENYLLVNETQCRADYFSNMFEVLIGDIGYGGVIAFNDGKIDVSFYEKANYMKVNYNFDVTGYLFDGPYAHRYPATRSSTIDEVKTNIIRFATSEEYALQYGVGLWCDYITQDDIFVSDEAISMKEYLAPNGDSMFYYTLEVDRRDMRVVAVFTRLINGFKTEEVIRINEYPGEIGNVVIEGERYEQDDLFNAPNIGDALEKMDLSAISPPHTDLVRPEMYFKYVTAKGEYRKIEGKVYGLIRVIWSYTYPIHTNAYIHDDMYFIYDESGNGSAIERGALESMLGDDYFVLAAEYNKFVYTFPFDEFE